MKLLMTNDEVAEDRARWLELRRNSIGASEIAAIMGIPGAFGSAPAVYWNKVAGDQQPSSIEMELGTYLEEFVATRFARAYPGLALYEGGMYASDELPWMTATFDRLAAEHETPDPPPPGMLYPVQIKTSATADDYGEDGSDEIPAHYLAQVIWEMRVGGFSRAFVPVLFLHRRQIRTYEIPYDADARADAELMIEEAQAFLRRVERQDPPPADWRPATTAALKRVYGETEDREVEISDEVAARLLETKSGFDAAKRDYLQCTNEIRALMGTAARAVRPDGTVVCTRSVIPVKEHMRKAGVRDTLRIKKAQ